MLSKEHRLTHRESDLLLQTGTSRSSRLFSVKVRDGFDRTKCAVAVSKKVAKKAVERNRIRRRVYAAIREIFDSLPQGSHFLFFARSGVKTASFEEIKNEIVSLIKRGTQHRQKSGRS